MTVTAPLQRLDTLTLGLSDAVANVTVLQANVADLANTITTIDIDVTGNANVAGNLFLHAPGGNVYSVVVSDSGALSTTLVT
ncbi:MAG: hypothetical protein ACO35C_04470 [Pontimonas sp.]